MSDVTHERFTASTTAYLRNLDAEDLRGEVWAIHHQEAPRPGKEPGSTIHSLRFPTLIVANYLTQPREVAEKVARILNQHWDDSE
jgi:hypothetical protein